MIPALALLLAAAAAASACGGSEPLAPTPTEGAALLPPTPRAPVGGVEIEGVRPTLEVNNAAASGAVGAVSYRFELSDASDFSPGPGTVVLDSVPQGPSSTSVRVPNDLRPASRYFWRARAASGSITTAFSAAETFRTENRGFREGQTIFDPLTNGQTVADEVHGGHFVEGANGGWQADSQRDSLDYSIPTCGSCRVEFDVTNFDRSTPPENVDLKWFSMGDGSTFNSFLAFRDSIWKMHIEKKSADAGAVKLIWRRGCNDSEGCDNTDNRKLPVAWTAALVYRFTLEWGSQGMSVQICEYNGTGCGATVYSAGGTGTYAPPNHRIQLGTRARGETLTGARFRNVRIMPR